MYLSGGDKIQLTSGFICQNIRKGFISDMVVHTCNPSTWEAKAGGFRIIDQLGLCSETLLEKII
jgi:hypothetical protein